METFTEALVKKYANDCELGAAVRNLINNYGEDLHKMQEFNSLKQEAGRRQAFEEAAKHREKEKEILDKIKKNLHLM